MKMLKAVGALVLVALAVPASASAHKGTVDVTCARAHFEWSAFNAGSNTVNWKVTVDNQTSEGTYTFSGTSASTDVPLNIPSGNHTVVAVSTWDTNGSKGETMPVTAALNCGETPPVAPPSPPAPPPTVTPPTQTVRGTQVQSGRASLKGPKRCTDKTFRVTVSGRGMSRVSFYVAGKRVRTVSVASGRRNVSVNLAIRQFGARRQAVQARVSFRNGTRKTLRATAARCAQGGVSPQFTG